MSLTKHTKGPWRMVRYTGHDPKNDWPGKIVGSNDQSVFDGPFSFRALCGKTAGEAEANARLIAASPDLLSEAKKLLALIDAVEIDQNLGDETDRVFPRYEFEGIRAAIRKAEEPTNGQG